MKKAVLLLSGGLDSASNLALHESRPDFEVVLALTVNYGQRSAVNEIRCSTGLAEHFGVEHLVVDFQGMAKLSGATSSLLNPNADVPTLSEETLDDLSVTTKTASAVWVPNRNAILLSFAAALAESRKLDAVAVGFNKEEAATFPDNSVDFLNSMTRSFSYSTSNQVQVLSHTALLTKVEIVERLAEKDFPFRLLWSCYRTGGKHCGRCESCQRLRRSLTRGIGPANQREKILSQVFENGDSSCLSK